MYGHDLILLITNKSAKHRLRATSEGLVYIYKNTF